MILDSLRMLASDINIPDNQLPIFDKEDAKNTAVKTLLAQATSLISKALPDDRKCVRVLKENVESFIVKQRI